MQEVNDDNFFAEILKGELPAIVEFYSETCAPCKQIMPILDKLAKDYTGKVKFAKISVQKNQKMPMNFNVMGVPNIIFFKNGKVMEQIMGLTTEDKIKSIIDTKLV